MALCLSSVMFKGMKFKSYRLQVTGYKCATNLQPATCNQFVVRMEGLEPPRLSAPDPKSGTATNYATCAKKAFFIKRERKFRDYLVSIKRKIKIALRT